VIRLVLVLILGFAAIARAQAPSTTTTTRPAPPLRILFIGDEYTTANGGIPAAVQALAATRARPMECAASTASGKTLVWQWESGAGRRRVTTGKWDYVVLQPSPVESTADALKLLDVIGSFAGEARKAGAKTLVLDPTIDLVPSKAQRALAQGLERLHEQSAARVVPVGAAVRIALAEDPSLRLRGDAGGPLPRAATYLAACAVYAMLFDDAVEGLASTVTTAPGRTLAVVPAQAKVIQNAVDLETTPWLPPTTGPAFGAAEERIVFIVDATGTMLGLKFKIVQEHLRQAVARLTPEQRFNIVYFRGGDSENEWRVPFALHLRPADAGSVREAQQFIDRTTVVGRGTNPLPALQLAFGLRPDVIYFISDGEFNNVVGYEQVIAAVRKLNARRRTRLNVIQILADDAQGRETLETLAREHGGRVSTLTDKGLDPATRPTVP
jgi:hypothetical protein